MLTNTKGITTSPKCDFVLSLVFLAMVVSSTSLVIAQPAGTFTPTGSMTIPRMSHTATLLADGRVLIAGGHIFSNGQWSGTWSAELYDPFTGSFTATGHMTTTRLSHTATLLPDGTVLMAGGLDGEIDPLACAAQLRGPRKSPDGVQVAFALPTTAAPATPPLPGLDALLLSQELRLGPAPPAPAWPGAPPAPPLPAVYCGPCEDADPPAPPPPPLEALPPWPEAPEPKKFDC